MLVPIVIGLILFLAVVSVIMLASRAAVRRRARSHARPASATRRAIRSSTGEAPSSTELEAAGRERSDETRTSAFGGLVRRRGGEVVEYEPVDEEEIGVSRRQFLNRAIGTAVGFGLAGFGAAMLAFLWPLQGLGGFGGTVNIGKLDDILAAIDTQQKPFYARAGPHVRRALPEGQPRRRSRRPRRSTSPRSSRTCRSSASSPLYQRCVHLGCRVPFCQTSQWFECPCHGSKYNRVGEKKAGPAPRGLDRFYATKSADNSIIVDTGTIYLGPPIGTNTTGQNAEGPLCV